MTSLDEQVKTLSLKAEHIKVCNIHDDNKKVFLRIIDFYFTANTVQSICFKKIKKII